MGLMKLLEIITKTDFVNKLTNYNRQITSNKTKHLEVEKWNNKWL